jgi:SAM-dependent methyltransferase
VLLSTIATHIRRGDLGILVHLKNARDETFAQWYITNKDGFAKYESTQAVPSLVAAAHGVVLDLGPGAGTQLPYFDAAAVTRVVGVEPNPAFVVPLKQRLATETPALEPKYELVLCGIEDEKALADVGITAGSVDSILCTQVLCSVDRPEQVARRLYELLKPGGQLLFWEHSRSDSRLTAWAQCKS